MKGAAQSTTTLLQMPPIHVRAREGAVAVHEQAADPELHVGTQAQPLPSMLADPAPVAALRRLYNHSRSCSPDPRTVAKGIIVY